MMNRQVRMIAADMDGTLMDSDKKITKRTWEAIEKVAAQGIYFVPASGRLLSMLPEALRKHPGVRYAVCANGASVVDVRTGAYLHRLGLPKEKVLELIRMLRPKGIHIDVFADGAAYTWKREGDLTEGYDMEDWVRTLVRSTRIQVDSLEEKVEKAEHLERLNFFYRTEKEKKELYEIFQKDPDLTVAESIFCNLEVSSSATSKGAALAWLAEYLGFTMEQVLAIGDGDNDGAMIRMAGIGVAMENALEEIKEAADVITASNDEDGAALAIERWALNP